MADLLEAAKLIGYDPESGRVWHKKRKNSNGSIDHYGYLILKIKGRQFKAHRLAWAKYYGTEPAHNIDHIDGNKLNNRINNLRDVQQVVNVLNTKRAPNKDTGVVGVHLDHSTFGLKAKFTTRVWGKTHRFRKLADAIRFREERGLPV